MDQRVARLNTLKDCEQFAKKHGSKTPDFGREARRGAIELRVVDHNGESEAKGKLQAGYTYEEVLSARTGKTCASRTWQMIKRHGIIPAVERAVNRSDDPSNYGAR